MDIQKEREAFERCFNHLDLEYVDGCGYCESETQSAWEAWQAAKADAVPEGFVLMPKEIDDFDHSIAKALEKGIVKDLSASDIYKAMIEAQEPAND